jgi:transcriptional regulator with GAF, ATPase, and Fis domain
MPSIAATIISVDPFGAKRGLIGSSQGIRHLLNSLHTVARTDSTILIQGETGTGKDLVAKAIHEVNSYVRRVPPATRCHSGRSS